MHQPNTASEAAAISKGNVKNPATKAARATRRWIVGWFALLSVPWVLLASWLAFAVSDAQLPRALYGAAGFAVCLFIGVFGLRPILMGIARMDRERSTLREQFDRARVESMSDSLTGLGNLRAFMDALDSQVAAAQTQNKRFALVMANVDNLKAVNDEHGHAAGDELLAATARIISGNMRRWDQAFRMGGDQFAVVLQDCGPEEGAIIAKRMLTAAIEGGVGGAVLIKGGFSLTLGVSAFPDPSTDRKSLLLQADAALRWGKEHGRTDVQLYDVRRHPTPVDAATIEELGASVLRVAATRAMTPVYQPIYSLTTGQVLGYEGLVRPKAETGFTNPGAMFNAAQQSGRTVELDMAALKVVLAGAVGLPSTQYLSVNLAPRTLEAKMFNPQEVLKLVRDAGIDPSRIVLELTERDEVTDMANLKDVLAVFRRNGVRTALDDCGEGSGKQMRWLVELSFNVMKIDMWFVRSKGSSGVLRGFGEMARAYNMTVVAEGIETPEHLEIVMGQGFAAGQGYLLRRPGPALDAPDLDLDALLGKGYVDPGAMISR